MKAAQFDTYGGAEVMHLVETAKPVPGAGQIRIGVKATAVNPSDWKRRKGLYREFETITFPAGVGVEAAGVVDEVGSGVANVAVGDAVFGYGNNTVAEYALLTHWVKKPEAMAFEIAAGLAVTSETAWRALDDLAAPAGATILISGAAGGIGSAAVQLARMRGLTVIGTASERNHDLLQRLGAIPTTYGHGLAARVRALAPQSIDGAIDIAGSGIIPELIEITGNPVRVVSVADFSAESFGAKFCKGPPRDAEAVLEQVARLWSEGAFEINVEKTFPISETAAAHRLSEKGHAAGKIVITVA